VEHREHRGRADAGADQDDRARAVAQDEAPARRRGVDAVADPQVLVQPAAGGAVALDADAVALLTREVRQ